MNKDIIALKKKMVVIPVGVGEDNTELASSIQAELMKMGFVLEGKAYWTMCKAPKDWLISYHQTVIEFIKKQLGADINYSPMYVNFPEQVMDTFVVELFFNAMMSYMKGGEWQPSQQLKERDIAFEDITEHEVIKLSTEKDFANIFTNLVSINQSLTQDDKEIVEWFVEKYNPLITPKNIPFKETLCMLAGKGVDVPVKNVTDVLRIAVYLSGGDISLPTVPKVTISDENASRSSFLSNLKQTQIEYRNSFKFKKFSRPERKYLLGLLERTNLDISEMQTKQKRWLRLGEVLHVGDYAKRFPNSAEAFYKLRNQDEEKIRTFNSKVNYLFETDWKKGVDLLSKRAGEFSRKLDWMVRTFDTEYVLSKFEEIGDKVSKKVLFELWNHFSKRDSEYERVIMIKGKRSIRKKLEPLKPMESETVNRIKKTILNCLKKHYANLPQMGKVYLDESLKDIPIPFSMRSINTAVKTYVRGTRIPYSKNAKVIRPYIHWYDENGDIDLDLSVGFYTEDFENISYIDYTNLKNVELNACHSGDIRHRRGAVAEYVDIDIQKALEKGVRYCLVQVHNFNNKPLHDVDQCVFGLMEREYPKENEIFLPDSISNAMLVANESPTVNICIFDLKESKYIWTDVEISSIGLINFSTTSNKSVSLLQSLTEKPEVSVYDILKLHVESRGELVDKKEKCDLAMEYKDFATDYAKVATYM